MKKLQSWNSNGTYSDVRVNDDELISRDIMPGHAVQSILDGNHELRATRQNPKAFGRHAARIPKTVWTEWRKQWMTTHRQDWTWQTFLAMKLNSRDYSHLKTHEGAL